MGVYVGGLFEDLRLAEFTPHAQGIPRGCHFCSLLLAFETFSPLNRG